MAEPAARPAPSLAPAEAGCLPEGLTLRLTLWAMVATDVAFLAYWTLVTVRLLPAGLMFAEYAEPRVRAWNWSFLPLDVAASLTGLAAARSAARGSPEAPTRLALSLGLTATAGGMAVAYWLLRGQLDPLWLAPNAFLLLFPLPLLVRLTVASRGRPPCTRSASPA